VPDPLAALRLDYESTGLDVTDVPGDGLAALRTWVDAAVAGGEREPTAMVVATVDADGHPSARTVLLKGIDTGLVFFTNRESRKGRELAGNPHAAAVLRWDGIHRQVTVRGTTELVDDAAADAYYASRPRGSRIGAWASPQSEVIADRAVLEERVASVEARFPADDVPRPPFWGGYRIVPDTVELWQGRPSRLHDRLRFSRADGAGGAWIVERLAP
jgi:pyridoxamine 5'-phosphate oxidase